MKKWLKIGLALRMMLSPMIVNAEEAETNLEESTEATETTNEETITENVEETPVEEAVIPVENETVEPQAEVIDLEEKDINAKTYTITYNANGGTFWDGSTVYKEVINAGDKAPNYYLERDYYVFEGWFTDRNCSPDKIVTFPLYPTSNMTLYAKWSKAYKITFVLNGGYYDKEYYDPYEEVPETLEWNIKIGEETWLYNEEDLIRPGYYLEGWYYDAAFTRKAGTKADKYSYTSFRPTSNVTLYARWVEAYTITLVSGRGRFNYYHNPYVREIWVAKGQSLGTNMVMRNDYAEPEMNGKAFSGWYSDESFSAGSYVGRINYEYLDADIAGLEYQELYNYYPTGDMTLYAKFADVYFIELDANGGLFTLYDNAETIILNCEKGRPFYLSYWLPEREGYEMVGWSKTRDGSSGIFRIWGHTPTNHEVFYAIWEKAEVFFTDVQDPSTYYYEPVYWAANNGITTGTSPTTFSPDDKCTRGQIVTFLWRLMGSPEPRTSPGFTDVKSDRYFYKAVAWAKENGITTGTSPTLFSPDAPCTRAQIVTFLWRTMGQPEPFTSGGFTDVKSDRYFYKAVAWAKEKGITVGTAPKQFSPDLPCTRAQCVTFLYRTTKS